MTLLNELIKPDKRSEGFHPDWIKEQFAEVPLSDNVPDNIKEMIILAQNLAYYGYFKYDFYDVAFFHLCLTLEAALRTKYCDQKAKYSKIIKKAKAEKLLPLPFETRIKHLKGIRNNHAHPKGVTIMPLFIRAFHITTYIINCIFDEEARKVYPSIFAKEIEENKRNKILYEALFRITNYNIKPGQTFEIAGTSQSYEKGEYRCIKCKTVQIINNKHSDLIPCEKCGEIIFLCDDEDK